MRLFCIVFILLFSTGISQSQNILDALEQRPNAKTERKILKAFKETICYTECLNYKIQPVYYLEFKHFGDSVLVDESLFLKNLRKPKHHIINVIRDMKFKTSMVAYYVIYNDSLQPVAYAELPSRNNNYNIFCLYNTDSQRDDVLQYAMANQFLIVYVSGFTFYFMFGYKDGKLYIFEINAGKDNFNIYPFEEFDWEQPYLLQWKEFLPVLHR